MNKLVKGSIAGAAGIALLLGGAGTLALWNATGDIEDKSISSGTLTLSAPAGTWAGPTLMVPGDVATYTTTVTITATGDNIDGTLKVDESSIAAGALATDLDIVLTAGSSTPALVDNANGTFDLDGAGTYVVPVTVTVTFDENSANGTQGQTVSLNSVSFLLEQHR